MNTRPKRKKVDVAIELSSDSESENGNEKDSKKVKQELLASIEPGMKRKKYDQQHDVVIDNTPRKIIHHDQSEFVPSSAEMARTRRRSSTVRRDVFNLSENDEEKPSETPLENEINAMSISARDLFSEKNFATTRSEIKTSPVTRIDRTKEKTKERTTRLNSQCNLDNLENLIIKKFGAEFKENKWQIARSEIQSDRFDEGLLEAEEIVCDRKILRGSERGGKEFRIKWRKYPDEEPTWENEENLVFCGLLISEYKVTKKRIGDEKIANWRKNGEEKLEANNGVRDYSGDRKNETGKNEFKIKNDASVLESTGEKEACICRCEKSIFKPENSVDKSDIEVCRCEEAEKSTKQAIEKLEKKINIQNEKNIRFIKAELKPLESKALALLQEASEQKTTLEDSETEINRLENEIAEKKRLIFESIGVNKLEPDVVKHNAESFIERRNDLLKLCDDLVNKSVFENARKEVKSSGTKPKFETDSSKYLAMKNELLIFEQKREQTAVEKFLLKGAIKSKTHAADFKKLHDKESVLRESCQELMEKINDGKQKLADTYDYKISKDKTRKILNENIKKIDEAKSKKMENMDFDKENTVSKTRKDYKTEKLSETGQHDEEQNQHKVIDDIYDRRMKYSSLLENGEQCLKNWENEWITLKTKYKTLNGHYWTQWSNQNPKKTYETSDESKKGGKYWKEKWESFEAEKNRLYERMDKNIIKFDMLNLVPDDTVDTSTPDIDTPELGIRHL